MNLGWLKTNGFKDILSLIAGVLLVGAFAPIHYSLLAVIAPAILLYCWLNTSVKRAFWRGWLFGIGLFGAGVSWLYISIHVYGNTPVLFAFLITAVVIIGLALFPALHGALLQRVFPKNNLSKFLIAFPALWVLFEWLRNWLLSGFPWLFLGYSQTDAFLKGYVPLVGIYGSSFIVVLTSGLLLSAFYDCKQSKKCTIACFVAIIILYLGGYGFSKIQWTHPVDNHSLQVSLIQGNIPQDLKWSPEFAQQTIERYQQLTDRVWDSDLIVWPEAAIPYPADVVRPFLDAMDQKAHDEHTALVIGIPVNVDREYRFYNSVLVLGQGEGRYDKKYLVPFGEYVPFESLLRGLMGVFDLPMSFIVPGEAQQALLNVDGVQTAVFICYEIAYEQALHATLPQAQLLLTVSNDAWFGDSLAPEQHVQIAQFRSLQSGRYQLFSSNDGITAIIGPQGKILDQVPQFTTTILTGRAFAMTGSTPWRYIGATPIIVLMFVLFVIAVVAQRRNVSNLKPYRE